MATDWKTVALTCGLICLCFVGIPIRIDKPSSQSSLSLFQSYIHKFNKSYNATEFEARFTKFQETLKFIEELNSNRPSNDSARYGLTEFSDMSKDEFLDRKLQKHLHRRLHHHRSHNSKNKVDDTTENHIKKRSVDGLPDLVDWRSKGVVGAVRNQKTCGACWAFSTVETIESMAAMKTGSVQVLSVQEIIDCAGNGNLGCNGGDTCSLLDWLVYNNVAIEPEKQYPLNWKTNACQLKGTQEGVRVASNYTCSYLVGREDALVALIANHGPVVVAVNALTWQHYLGGVVQFHCDGAPEHINHAVQIVGYDRTAAIPHYIVRNSWGTAFGDNGYLYLAMGNNMCGVGTEVASLDVIL
ncbi:Cathepsin O [Frankliniella fusca]|uniref:Cathepsin O n=1 Tax=Frankliniella fusca TaxID=407009 RepID=A0AAE1LIQ5_9NEOP|nr:Cathepsin O [Frankliniella fusca]